MASYSPPTMHSNQPQFDTENWLFLGNPGTGKSTLINCLIGEAKFEAGLSFGAGKTSFFQRFEHGNIVYMDTPGLADTELRETAAKSIKEALQEDGIYKIFFVVTLQQGRGKARRHCDHHGGPGLSRPTINEKTEWSL
ncbi:50S ribosome-binding GTPase [Phytophthora infestans]|uniref:50S ribosome-binding GTPase n=1 Tax=Phytophthora infestans TaxID=4787 RepID=A0A833SVG3_PHYIN|nr:50S ribosome-binding GTPase [Phytophthora infestans]